ncbi:N-acetylglucosamine kinase [Rhizobium sp. TRM95796]|uniref:N-acetylglucosamine kinase n=1 Tax=Rhizobium sp. TRM95796 TaxID=2979862 RepID=UPI0021E9428A|nr:BadF/BadG/BcrA/BcrD ATPase family protein [Rhizobium sp. TRM95796]MCV3767765.1 N-acetylglucosamine kinase [Rhizobium sp. TRM95796]
MTLIFGLDSGGSKTIAAVATADGAVIDVWRGPGLDPMAGEGWTAVLATAVDALCGNRSFASSVLGLSCHGEIDAVSAHQRAVVAAHFPGPHLVLNDVEVACDAAFAGRDGVLLLAGTGSMAWAKVAGRSVRFGGWGEAFGDEGSAFWIGREALSLASRVLDGRLDDPSGEGRRFADGVLAACGVSADDLIEWAFNRGNRRADYAALAQTVSAMGEQGNDVAAALLDASADRLAEHVFAARRALGAPDLDWSYAGGVFRSAGLLAATANRAGEPVRPRLPPIGGALWRAAEHAGLPITNSFLETLAASLEDH